MSDSYVPYEILRKLPYKDRIPENIEDEWEMFQKDVSDIFRIWKSGDTDTE